MRGSLIAFEGLDQSGKQTQAESLRDALARRGHRCEMLSFPAYETAIGEELHRALHGGRDYTPDVMQLLYVANRYEIKPSIERWLGEGRVVLCDRYVASSVAYGVAQGLDATWLHDIQRFLPEADLTILLDITPDVAVARKAQGRDRFERDLALLDRVRDSYRMQAARPRWTTVAASRPREEVTADVQRAVSSQLGLL